MTQTGDLGQCAQLDGCTIAADEGVDENTGNSGSVHIGNSSSLGPTGESVDHDNDIDQFRMLRPD